jgi:hypothetical protein
VGKTKNTEPTPRSHEKPASSPAALVAFIRLLARYAAHEAFASAEPALASKSDHSELEDSHEARV